jgi:hypothetical protein
MSLAQQKPTVRIKVNASAGGTRFEFQISSRRGPEVLELRSAMTVEDWRKERRMWLEKLESFREILEPEGSGLLDPPFNGRAASALSQLQQQGEALFRRLSRGRSAEECKSISTLGKVRQKMALVLRESFGFDYGAERFVKSKDHSKAAQLPLVVVQSRDEDMFPWETLPWLPPKANENDLCDIARCFLGFSAITFRQNSEVQRARFRSFNVDSGFAVTSYVGGNLPSQPRELRFLDQLAHVKARPWTIRRRLNPARGFSCWSSFVLDALREKGCVHHFAGHGHPDSECHRIVLSPGKSKRKAAGAHEQCVSLRLDDLAKRISEVVGSPEEQDFSANDPSLVFFNLCSSGALLGEYRGRRTSLPTLVQHLGHSTCIVTEAKVGHAFASAFAKRFYVAFLHGLDGHDDERALSVGEALLWSKWHFLRLYRNPQGLLYTLRGHPEVRVRQPIPYVFPK